MEAALQVIVPKIIGDLSFQIYTYECKQDMLRKLPQRLKGYASWLPAGWRILVILDRDGDDCRTLKHRLENDAHRAGLRTPSHGEDPQVFTRIAVEELEAWFFGDWPAVCEAYPRVQPGIPKKKQYRDPDAIAGGTWESFERILQRAGYYRAGLPKISAARNIARHMEPRRNRSQSFQVFHDTLLRMANMPVRVWGGGVRSWPSV
ncbi:MAG: DUF4276 family protein [Bryobacterales bacterium]|nr:DUF4276 family protein [Bryobacterales bacterium]